MGGSFAPDQGSYGGANKYWIWTRLIAWCSDCFSGAGFEMVEL